MLRSGRRFYQRRHFDCSHSGEGILAAMRWLSRDLFLDQKVTNLAARAFRNGHL